MSTKYRIFPYTRYFKEGDAAAGLYSMEKKKIIRLLAHEIIDAFYIYRRRPAAITKTICAALNMIYEAGRAAGLNERPDIVHAARDGSAGGNHERAPKTN